MPSYLFLCIYVNAWYITCCPKREALEIFIVIGEVLVLGLLVVVYKIPYSCMWARQDAIGVFPSYYCIWYDVCACHSLLYFYITATVVYLVKRIIDACVVVIWSQSLSLSRMKSQRRRWVWWKSSNTRWKSGLILNTYTGYHICVCKIWLVCAHHTAIFPVQRVCLSLSNIPLSIRYNVCACHSPIYHNIIAISVYLVHRTLLPVSWLCDHRACISLGLIVSADAGCAGNRIIPV